MFLTTLFINANCYGQRIINGIETWTSTGITTQGTPSAGPTPTLGGGIYNVPFDIIIRPGATLIISNCTVQMGSSAQANLQNGITVFAGGNGTFQNLGGLLIVRGSNLTRNGVGLWRGISVLGDPTQPQNWITPYNSPLGMMNFQGLVLIESSRLSFALSGIRTWDGLSPQNAVSGGVIWASNSDFVNNVRSIQFERYTNWNNPNISFIKECRFIWNDPSVNLYCGISGWNVRSVPIERNTFNYQITATNFSISLDHIGIDGDDFNFIATDNVFTNTKIGIYNRAITGFGLIDARGNKFINNWRGILSSGLNASRIENNQISGLVPTISSMGILHQFGSGYTITNNSFFNTSTSSPGIGLNINQSGSDYNVVRNNSFYTFQVCSQSERNNVNTNDPEQGLKFLCNNYFKSTLDLNVFTNSIPTPQGISTEQGRTSVQRNAKNQFSRSLPAGSHLDINTTTTTTTIFYFYCCAPIDATNPEHPFFVSGNVVPVSHPWTASCPAPQLKQAYQYPEDAEFIYSQIQHYRTLSLESNDSLYYWVNLWNTPHGKLLKTDLLMEEGRYSEALNTYDEIASNLNMYPIDSMEFNFFGKRLLDLRLTLAAEERSIFQLNENEIISLEGIADSADSWAKARAENWLRVIKDRPISDSHGYPDFQEILPRLVKADYSITFYPNPTQNELELDYINLNDKGSELEIFNIVGKLISTINLEGEFGHKSFDLTDWNSGIYFYEVKFKGLVFANGKFVKQ